MRKHWYTQRGVYVAPDLAYRAAESTSRVRQLATIGHVSVYGYRSETMSAGFGADKDTARFVRELSKIAWVYDPEKGELRHGAFFGDRAFGVASGSGRVAIHVPDERIMSENEHLAQYRKAMKFHAIKVRRGVASHEPEPPLLVKLAIGTDSTSLLDYLLDHCAFVLQWAFSECGAHFRSIDGTANAKSFLLAKFAEANLPVFEIDDPDDLPYD